MILSKQQKSKSYGYEAGLSKEMGPVAYGENEEEIFLGRSVASSKICQKKLQEKWTAKLENLLIWDRQSKKSIN